MTLTTTTVELLGFVPSACALALSEVLRVFLAPLCRQCNSSFSGAPRLSACPILPLSFFQHLSAALPASGLWCNIPWPFYAFLNRCAHVSFSSPQQGLERGPGVLVFMCLRCPVLPPVVRFLSPKEQCSRDRCLAEPQPHKATRRTTH